MTRPATLGELRASGWVSRPVKEEIRANAVVALAEGRRLVDGVIGYESTVLPQLANAMLAGHDVIFLGERGQAKTRIIRSLTNLLDEWMPIVAGSEINDDPYHPVSPHARHLIADRGDETPIEWVHRDRRYGEKLATPDTSIASHPRSSNDDCANALARSPALSCARHAPVRSMSAPPGFTSSPYGDRRVPGRRGQTYTPAGLRRTRRGSANE